MIYGIGKTKMRPQILDIIGHVLVDKEIIGKRILEAGSMNVNGSVRPMIELLYPAEYLGVDIRDGNGVDQICNIYELTKEFGENSFDGVVCTETLEHVRNWVLAVSNLKNVLKPGGFLIVSAPSRGFHKHDYPHDYWRFQRADFKRIFSDMQISVLEMIRRGVVMKAAKPQDFKENDLSKYKLYSVNNDRRILVKHNVD